MVLEINVKLEKMREGRLLSSDFVKGVKTRLNKIHSVILIFLFYSLLLQKLGKGF